MRIDPTRSFSLLDQKVKHVSDKKHVAMLENLRDHMAAELIGDIDRIMSTLVPDPIYHYYGFGDRTPQRREGYEAIRSRYEAIFAGGFNVLVMDWERFLVDDYGIAGDGIIRIITPGRLVPANTGETVDDPDAHYLVSTRLAVFLPYQDGLMLGEDTYGDLSSRTVTKLDPSEVVTTEELHNL